jgi:hypothetical protein
VGWRGAASGETLAGHGLAYRALNESLALKARTNFFYFATGIEEVIE